MQCGIYQHYKGKKYFVIGVAVETETGEDLVIYVPLYEHPNGGRAMQARPKEMFEQSVLYTTTEGAKEELVPRFKFIGEKLEPKHEVQSTLPGNAPGAS